MSSWISYCDRSLEFARDPTTEEWQSEMLALNAMEDSGGFWRGDLYLKGEDVFGEEFASSILEPGEWKVKTWANNASVCRRIPPSERNHLSYSHHAEVAYLPQPLRLMLLRQARDEGLTVKELRQEVRETKAGLEGKSVWSVTGGPIDRIEKALAAVARLFEVVPKGWAEVRDYLLTAQEALEEALEAAREIEADAG